MTRKNHKSVNPLNRPGTSEDGNFVVGCNYWASHAGCFMWRQWNPEIVRQDFKRLAALKLQCIRIFPLWPDFQPLTRLYSSEGRPYTLAWRDESSLPADGTTVDPEMLARLRLVCDCAAEQKMTVIVSLVTGWMSGRRFTPPAFAERNLFTDPEVVYYETCLVREVVTALRDHNAIVMWEPGNECNCMSPSSHHTNRLWLETIVQTIRLADPSRPVAAGMHGLVPAVEGEEEPATGWRIGEVGRVCDVLTTHPYPMFTEYAATDRLGSFKSLFHATAENRFYADLSGRPCFAEELGTLSGVSGGEQAAGDYLQGTLLNLFFHDGLGLFWWCAFDQDRINRPPYSWCAVERELGLFDYGGRRKPVGEALRSFAGFAAQLPVKPLPAFQRDAVVLLTTPDAAWGAAWGAFLLAKQAHFDVEFRYVGQPLPERALYIVPSVAGMGGIPPEQFSELQKRAEAGATVFISSDGAMFAPFGPAFGFDSDGYDADNGTSVVEYAGERLECHRSMRLHLRSTESETLASDAEGMPVFTRRQIGKGMLYFLSLPLEKEVVSTSGATGKGYFRIYETIGETVRKSRPLKVASPRLTVTIHPVDVTHVWAAIVNNGFEAERLEYMLAPGWRVVRTFPAADDERLPSRGWRLVELER